MRCRKAFCTVTLLRCRAALLLAVAIALSGCAALRSIKARWTGEPPALDLVMQQLYLTRQDLAVRNVAGKPDPFLLGRVRSAQEHPIGLAGVARAIDAGFHDHPHTLSALVMRAADLLEVPVRETDVADYEHDYAAGLPGALEELVAALQNGQELFGAAFEELDEEEAGFVKSMLEEILFRGEWPADRTRWDNQVRLERTFRLASRIDLRAIATACLLVAQALDNTMPELMAQAQHMPAGRRLQSAIGDIVIGTPADDAHEGDAPLLLIDPGGDDTYRLSTQEGMHIIVDIAGNDTYEAGDSASPGTGIFGLGFLVDVDGDDQYRGSEFAWGCGLLGAGVLADLNGNDSYTCRSFGQGAAAMGIGLLYDQAGDDLYQSQLYSQGLGYVGGVGLLADMGGDDHYASGASLPDSREEEGAFQTYSQGFGMGCRQFASGGIGLLYDRTGDDNYSGSYFCQASSYWQSLGLLIDADGDDRFSARRYAQGAGIHSSAGGLFDYRGNDTYVSWGVSQGCGHDYGIGLLYDRQGADQYTAEWLSQGAGGSLGLGMLIDEAGDDIYTAGSQNVQGCGEHDARRDAASIGIFVDGAGRDVFTSAARRQKLWLQGDVGAGIDAASGRAGVVEEPGWQAPAELLPGTASADAAVPSRPGKGETLPELEGPLFSEDLWKTASETLAGRGPRVIPLLCTYLAIKDVAVHRTIEETFKLLAKSHLEDVHAAVRREAADEENAAFLLYVLGDAGSPGSRDLFLEQLRSPLVRAQAMALRGLYKLKMPPPPEMAEELARSRSPAVRRYLGLALGAASDQNSIRMLCDLLADSDFQVRHAAYTVLKARREQARPLLKELRQRAARDSIAQGMASDLLEAR
jgi:hypothetical protein